MRVALLLAISFLVPALYGQEGEIAKFGTTVVIPSGLEGRIYTIRRYSKNLPDFSRRKPIGTIYTTSLNIPLTAFNEGFPGVTNRFEWFALDYRGRFWIEKPAEYTFSLTSDDGSKLYINDDLLIDNDGQHVPVTKTGAVNLSRGIHRIRVSYFQGPRFHVALILEIAGPGEKPRVFSTDEFKPPPNPENWPPAQ